MKEKKGMVFMCRWPNGETSFIGATSKTHALLLLSAVGVATEEMLTPIKEFLVHLGQEQLARVWSPKGWLVRLPEQPQV